MAIAGVGKTGIVNTLLALEIDRVEIDMTNSVAPLCVLQDDL